MTDAVETIHRVYTEREPIIKRIRDVMIGDEAVKAGGETYLPRLDGYTDEMYERYLNNGVLFSAASRTLHNSTGLVFRKPIAVEDIQAIDSETSQILKSNFLRDYRGSSLQFGSYYFVKNVFSVGAHAIFVEFPDTTGNTIKSLKDFNEAMFEPYTVQFDVENIINWDIDMRKKSYNFVVVKDDFYERYNRFQHNLVKRYLVLEIIDGKFVKEVWTMREQDDNWKVEQSIPSINGKPLTEIPLYTLETYPTMPMFLPLVNMNLAHYRLETAMYNGLPLIMLPTPYIIGCRLNQTNLPDDDKNEKILPLGPANAFYSEAPETKVGMFTYSGDGIKNYREELDSIERKMAVLGSRALSNEKKVAETEEVVNIHRAGENASIAMTVTLCSEIITKAYRMMLRYKGVPEDKLDKVFINLNTDFIPSTINLSITELSKLFQDGLITYKTAFENLRSSDVIAFETDFQEYEKEITKQKEEKMKLAVSIFNQREGETVDDVVSNPVKAKETKDVKNTKQSNEEITQE